MVNRSRGLLVLPFLIAGCLSDEGNPSPDGGALPEAGANDATTYDAGTSDAPIADAGVVDATIDAPIEAGANTVTMNTLKRGLPESGVTIVFSDATGAFLSSATTGATGSVSQSVPAGSQVTVIFGSTSQPQIVTVQGVEPGDVLSANDDSDESLFEQVSVDGIPSTPPAGTASYTLSAGAQCFNSSVLAPPATLIIQDTCQSAGKFPLLIEAFDANAAPLGFSFVKGIALDPPEGGMPSIVATGPWSTAVTTQTLTVSNVPAGDGGIAPGYLSLSEVVSGVALPSGNSVAFDGTVLDGGATSGTFRIHQTFADFVQEEATMRPIGSGGSAYNAIAKRSAAPTASATDAIDLAQLLPAITAASVDTTTPARPSVSWTSAGSLATADGIAVELQWYTPSDAGRGSWLIIAPPSATSIKAPALPASFADYLPPDAQSIFSPPVVTAVEASFLTGYAQLRAAAPTVTPSKELIGDFGTAIVPPLPINGTVRITALTQNLD